MIFTYQYINHDVEKFQVFLDFLFHDVWLVAEGEFDIEKLNGNPELKNIYEEFGNVDYDSTNAQQNQKGKSACFFNSSIENIYKEFSKIDDDTFKLELKNFYDINNDIDALCRDKVKIPICYKEIKDKYPDLEKALRSFYSKLYGNESPFNLAIFGKLNDELIQSHYKAFVEVNDDGICPFCGIYPIDDQYVKTREAYDHYLPKATYPFSSINFKNLSPMCNKCNSGNKGSIDPIEHIKGRKLAFYPYANHHPDIEFKFTLLSPSINNKITPSDFKLEISCVTNQEELNSWERTFKLSRKYKIDGSIEYYGRYDELICNKHSAKEWYDDIYDYFENAKTLKNINDAEEYYDKVIRATKRNDKSVIQIIKRKFLEECKSKGIFRVNVEAL